VNKNNRTKIIVSVAPGPYIALPAATHVIYCNTNPVPNPNLTFNPKPNSTNSQHY